MNDLYLTSFKVKGIKSLEKWAELSFYKKTFTSESISPKYNIKSIYGANGSGKTSLITAIKILKSIITDSNYLNSSLNQRKLSELVNKKLGYLEFDVEYFTILEERKRIYRYQVKIEKNSLGIYSISSESLHYRNPRSHQISYVELYSVFGGELKYLKTDELSEHAIKEKTLNLLNNSSLVSSYFMRGLFPNEYDVEDNHIVYDFILLFLLGKNIYVYMDSEDKHDAYFLRGSLQENHAIEVVLSEVLKASIKGGHEFDDVLQPLHPETMVVHKEDFNSFKEQVDELCDFLKIFKKDLISIAIDERVDHDLIHCDLILQYSNYSVASEFESTGIKKLIKLFSYFQMMVQGKIVFIDELDSNLHDVYLCALLEFLMEYGQGQLCFTTHNVGPMDVLKNNRKSIDFLSTTGDIYSWTVKGHYSPSKLYREGMITGSPFNVDSVDFLEVFGRLLEDDGWESN